MVRDAAGKDFMGFPIEGHQLAARRAALLEKGEKPMARPAALDGFDGRVTR